MAVGTCGAYAAIEMESDTDPLISQTVEGQGRNNSLGAAPGVSVANDKEQQKIQEPKDFLNRFNDIFDNTTSTKLEKKKSFETLLKGDDVNLKNNDVQKAFIEMLNDIDKYEEFLKLFIERFAAYNERIETKYLINKDQNTMRDLDAPLHCAVRQLNKRFIEWLLEQPETDVNLRNNRRETALAILGQKYDSVSKLKTRLEDIEKEREKADKKQKIRLDNEKIEVSAQKEELEEEMNAPTILELIKGLLVKGADFDIYMNDGALPFDFMRKYETKAHVAEIINSYAKSNVAMTEKPPKQLNVSAEGYNDTKKQIVKIYKENEDMDVHVTVELLAIFIRLNDLEKFKHYWKDFKITSDNVKKVITQLLHVAVVLNYTVYVENIVKKGSEEIFKLEENIATEWNKQEENNLVHRTELKGLLKTVCLNGNKTLLNMFLKMVNDRLFVNENPLLINTLNGAYRMKQKKESIFLLECIKILINNHSKVDMYRVDRNGNTALHLALSYGYDKIASLMLKKVYGLLGFRNRQNKSPIECGSTKFWNTYLDSCISTNDDESELRFNVDFLKPRAKDEFSDTSKSSSSKWYSRCIKRVKQMKPASKYSFTRTVNDMTALRLISQSTDRKEFLMHPVIIAFITMKWKCFCHWITLDLLLTTITMGTFIAYTLMSCSSEGRKYSVMAGVGAYTLFVREIMQMLLLGWSYVTLENLVDIINVVFIGVVLGCGCERDGWCEYVPICSSIVVVSLAIQATFLLGALWNKLSITLYMFKTVSNSFFYSLLSFTLVIGAFIYSLHLMHNGPSGFSISNGTESNSSEENFNNFHLAWDATIKTLVMTTGEFEAANITYDVGKRLLFVAFLFIASIVILNLINGLSVSDIAAIRKESEFISVYKKVRMLERYERAIVQLPGCLQWLFRDPLLLSPFFENYESIIYVNVNEKNKLAIKTKTKEKNIKEVIPGLHRLPKFCLKHYIGIRSIQLVPYMSLDQPYVDKAKTIVRRQSVNNCGDVTNELADMEQIDKPTLVNKITMNQHNTMPLSRSSTGPSVPESRDKQIEKLQVQVRNCIAMLTDIQEQLSGSHAMQTHPFFSNI